MEIMPEIAMFRRFGALNARSLLYYQNELAHLEDQLKELEAEDANSPDGKKATYSMNAFWLNTADFEVDGKLRDGDMRQRELVLQIRRVLKEYSMTGPKEMGRLADISQTMHSSNKPPYSESWKSPILSTLITSKGSSPPTR